MADTLKRIKNPESLARLGAQLRSKRVRAKIAQGKVRGMRQATVSKIENGSDATIDTFISYATSLGLEVALVPIGQSAILSDEPPLPHASKDSSRSPPRQPVDLLTEFDALTDKNE